MVCGMGMKDLVPWSGNLGLLNWQCRVLATGPLVKSLTLFSPCQKSCASHPTIQSWQCRKKLEMMGLLKIMQFSWGWIWGEGRERMGENGTWCDRTVMPTGGDVSCIWTPLGIWCKLYSIKNAYIHITGCEVVHGTPETIHRSWTS